MVNEMAIMEERRKKILEEVLKKGTVTVHDLSQKFNVSYETIRKDLNYLSEKDQLVKSHGGAISNQNSIENPFTLKREENIERKQSIAKKALSLIPNGASVILGTGSTVYELAKLLVLRNNLKIITDLIPAVSYLQSSNNEVYFLGGKLRPKSSSVYGSWTEEALDQINVDISFIGSDGFHGFLGPTTPSYSDSAIERKMIFHSEKSYILADSTKFERKSLYEITDWKNVTGVITNNDLKERFIKRLSKHTKVILDNFKDE